MTKEITVLRDNARDLKFTGEQIAFVTSKTADKGDRWTELTLYRTGSGKLICSQVGFTCWEKEHDRHTGAVCETNDEVIEFFGLGWLAKELYAEAKIDTSETID